MSLPLIVGIAALLLPMPGPPHGGPYTRPACWEQSSQQQPQTTPAAPDQNEPAEQPKTETSPGTPVPEPKAPEQPKSPERSSAKSSGNSKSSKARASNKSKHHKKKPVAQPPADGPKKIVVRHGSTVDPEVQFTPGMSPGQANYQKQTTEQLLAGTEANLKTASARQLQPGEQDSLEQIKSLMEQSKLAIVMGDLQRARTLAYKAQLLSNELVKH